MKGLAAALLVLLAACAPTTLPVPPTADPASKAEAPRPAPEKTLVLKKTSFGKITGWRGDRHDQAVRALLASCGKIAKMPAGRAIGPIGGTAGDWLKPCLAAGELPAGDAEKARQFFERHFRPYLATADGRPEGLFTGYFEMQLRGSWLRKAPYDTPLYERPPELVEARLGDFKSKLKGQALSGKVAGGRFVPFEDRAAIEAGALAGRGLELMWVDSPIDAFFLHVQGSGRVVMDDGAIIRVGFAARNGHAYSSIGRELIKRGEIARERVSMQSIRAWLTDHPDQAASLMASNRSFIFFRVVDGALKSLDEDQGPIGAQGVALTPGRSLAVDRRHLSLGLPVWLDTTDPINPNEPLRRLVIAQDTGSAIRGPVRGDLFWGFGEGAALRAGLMKQTGRYVLLLPKK